MIGGFSATQILFAAAKLGVVDLVRSGVDDAEAMANVLAVRGDALRRFLRMLVVVGILEEEPDNRFRVTGRGELLSRDHPDSLLDRILYVGEINYDVSRHILTTMKTGKSGFEEQFGASLFDYLAQRPEHRLRFDNLMAVDTGNRVQAIMRAYDFGRARQVVDVGGGSGELLLNIVMSHPNLQGVIFDLPDGISHAANRPSLVGLGDRMKLVSGDIFAETPPAGADIYLVSNVVHDWDDERSITILAQCRRAAGKTAQVLLVTELLPDRVADAPATIANDFSMLMLTGGRERTSAQYESLLKAADLTLEDIRPLHIANGRLENWALLIARSN
jgi:hypothetical protein